MYDEERSHLKQLLDNAVIRPSHSPFASAIVIVRKKNGTIRMCVDVRQLNKQNKKDSYALPRIEEILDYCAGSKFFSVLDITMTIAEANGEWDGLITALSNSCLRWDLSSSYIDGGIRLYRCFNDVSSTMSMLCLTLSVWPKS
jgi:hypothetical protein